MTTPIKTVDFEEGLEVIVGNIVNSEVKPYVVTIIGVPHSGKTRLRVLAKERLATQGVYGWGGMQGDDISKIGQTFCKNPQFALIEDVTIHEISDEYTRKLFGKNPDLRVYITRPNSTVSVNDYRDIRSGHYGLVIENDKANYLGKL
jgi:hypothetical protein